MCAASSTPSSLTTTTIATIMPGSPWKWQPKDGAPRLSRKKIAEQTLNAIKHGHFDLNGVRHDLATAEERSSRSTKYYAPNSLLSTWSQAQGPSSAAGTHITISEISTLEGLRNLATSNSHGKIAVLNFASAKNAGGGFLGGACAQEESLARSSTLYPSLMTETAQEFYRLHNRKNQGHGFYTHAMIYSPSVLFFRDDDGKWLDPVEVDVVTSPAVNAGAVRADASDKNERLEENITNEMWERMGRVLFLCEKMGAKTLVLGSFGTGVFKNKVSIVARHWADLLAVPGARFASSFSRIEFAILGKETINEFREAFGTRRKERGAIG
ncbi:uncharacterized protein BT62DRAFT_1073223 [Guyanagaster necrorhizus]|uniref:Microbial-type PARG catalytic domain-containing protein n=1 Tax=Guyanagaster necrorhizus TaxID=856835 RepID=A0A9P8AVR3_9AGAR|nr:uncharacterized protein BT62DRAFT_1073223 [Guyanagaster necrorhizus MCA 3950]KAG7449808.1 hypothetical protein BT62DRAFT_1073223 [Guyanagaster necrorhizus MCA 3950]